MDGSRLRPTGAALVATGFLRSVQAAHFLTQVLARQIIGFDVAFMLSPASLFDPNNTPDHVTWNDPNLDLAAGRLRMLGHRNRRSSRQWHDQAQTSATNIIREGLKTLELSEDQLNASRGSEPRKVSLAWAIARSTTMSQSWIATRLNMRSAANVSQQVRRFERELKRQANPRIKRWVKTVKNC